MTLRPATVEELRSLWPTEPTELLLGWRPAGGNRTMSVEYAPGIGYRVWALRHGTHIVSEDGRTIASAPPGWGGWRWQRLLFAQVLPLAAKLQGFELLHASAVHFGQAVVAFVASSGTGKSTLAANLVARGARFVTDDVLALACSNGVVVAHPGPALLGLTEAEYRRMPAGRKAALGSRLGRSGKHGTGKTYFAPEVARRPGTLAGICFLERCETESDLSLREQIPPEPRRLLSAGFLAYLKSRNQLVDHLSSCAGIAAATRAFTLRVPASMSPADLARRVEEELRSVLEDS